MNFNGQPENKAKPRLELIRNHPAAAAAISKAVKAHLTTGFDVNKKETYYSLNQGKIKQISDTQKDRLKENDNILDMFPDILLAEQIIISSILAPKDMFSGNLIYQTIDTLLPQSIQSKLNDVIKSHLESYYDITNELPEIIRAALFRTGSYVSAVIPEAAIDDIINGRNYATESHKSLVNELIDQKGHSQSLGILGPSVKEGDKSALENFFNNTIPSSNTSPFVILDGLHQLVDKDNKLGSKEKIFTESASTEKFLEITDNYQLVKLPSLLQAIASQRVKRAVRNPSYSSTDRLKAMGVSVSTENQLPEQKPKRLSNVEFRDLVYKNIGPKSDTFTVFPSKDNQKRHSIGRPLRIRIPSEAVVPVYPPGDPSNHRGYFVLVDIDGNWVTRTSMDTSNAGLQAMAASPNSASNLTSLMLQKAKQNVTDSSTVTTIDNMLEIYSSIIENDMVNRLRNGVYGTKMEVGKDKEWDRIMLARALSGKMSRLVYIPNELITYYAYDYHQNGIGKSYLDQIKLLTSLRGVLLFSKIMAQMKNAINITKVDMTLDPEDPDPQKTVELATHSVAKLRESYFPLGVNSPSDLMHWIQKAGLMFSFKGHPGLPETSFEFSTANLQHQIPDKDTTDDLRKQTFMTFGLTPEQVDEGFSANFATTIIQQNAMFAKRISLLSDKTAKHLTEDVKNICINDTIILQEFMKILKEGGDLVTQYLTDEDKEEYKKEPNKFLVTLLDRIVDNIWVDLPKPNITSQTVKAEDFKTFEEMLDKVLTSFISEEVFAGPFAGELSGHANEIKMFWKHFLLRKWVTDEGFMPDIAEIFKRDESGKPSNDILSVMDNYTKDVMLSAVKLIEKLKKSGDAVTTDLTTLNVGAGTSTASSTPSPEMGGEGDMFGLGTDLETPPEETEEVEEKPPETPEPGKEEEKKEEEKEEGEEGKETPPEKP